MSQSAFAAMVSDIKRNGLPDLATDHASGMRKLVAGARNADVGPLLLQRPWIYRTHLDLSLSFPLALHWFSHACPDSWHAPPLLCQSKQRGRRAMLASLLITLRLLSRRRTLRNDQIQNGVASPVFSFQVLAPRLMGSLTHTLPSNSSK